MQQATSSSNNPYCHLQTAGVVEIAIEFALAVPSFAINILLWTSYRKIKARVLNDSFFTLYLLSSGLSMTFFVVNLISSRIPGVGMLCDFIRNSILVEPSYIMTVPYFLQYFLPYALLLSNIAIATNRMCAVIFPAQFQKITGYLTRPSIITVFLLPLPFCWHVLVSPIYFQPVMNGFGMSYVKFVDYPRNSLIHLILHLACGLIVVLLTLLTALGMAKMEIRRRRTEVSLILVVAFESLGTVIAAAQSFAQYYLPSTDDFLYTKRFIIVDYQCFCPAWSLFVLSENVRREIIRFVRGWWIFKCTASNRRVSSVFASNYDTSQY